MNISAIKQCPICGETLGLATSDGSNSFLSPNKGAKYVYASCHKPSVEDPLHYYSNYVFVTAPDIIVFERLSVNIGNKSVLVAFDHRKNQMLVWSKVNSKPIEVPIFVEPDYPKLINLKKKIKLLIAFS